MKTIYRSTQSLFRRSRQEGSALLVSLMVMVGLSLLGLGFVAITETESAIAINERNTAQALAAAEAGGRVVVEWFQDPDWCESIGVLPQNLVAFKTRRRFEDPARDGYYKFNAMEKLFDKPFRGSEWNRFYGDGDLNPPTSDIWIYRGKNTASDNFLRALNERLFFNSSAQNETVRINDIRVYAPPVPGGRRNVNGFWEDDGQARYGVATVRVTAQKVVGRDCFLPEPASGDPRKPCRVVAERHVKGVVAETPFPTVDGAIETSGTLVGQGSFEVYWGKVLSEKGIQLARPAVGLPWFDATNTMWFEYGYDSAWPREDSKAYTQGDRVMAPAAAQAANTNLLKISYRASTTGSSADAATAPAITDWTAAETPGAMVTDGGVTWVAEASVTKPIEPHWLNYSSRDWFYQILGKVIEDPWLHARARQEIRLGNNKSIPCAQPTAFHPCKYNDPVNHNISDRYSNMFQNQYTTLPQDQVEVVFPTMDYEFWKNVAMSSNNENGVYYFRYADGANGTSNDFIGPGGRRASVYYWLNALKDPTTGKPKNGLGAGFYFFDTKNSRNPQFEKGGLLTPDISINSGSIDEPFQMQGYIYLNARFFGTTGQGNMVQDDIYPMPGEPYRDVGIREVDLDSDPDWKYELDGGALPAGDYLVIGANNGVWDFQDVNSNASFDLYLEERTVTRPDGTTTLAWMPVPFFEGCEITDNTDDGLPVVNGCSEPHEPYLNLTYPIQASRKGSSRVEWYDPATATPQDFRKPKIRTGVNVAVTCSAASSLAECTSNKYDIDGALVTIDALLWGALYNEGGYDGSGNARYYGALLMRASFNSTGTPEVYFNECLARGCLEEQLKLQRVTITSWQTEQ